ncbi:MAG TPA: hypothetical protein PK079_10330 [Leptospiraceae bacterium]|nr:hypothetical protein [Leptospiraceae bacterium]HMW06180.1 hypothetical protein [Leptospiraceae bacterium]HMX30692.1 hypothetical protein [Leptospiraceae bacterium]HMY31841.1 hypothetical protein [Leptospiraceae bacterium]HMZ64957.1 hypothetical protein [Leptospiraceae bacterium]
MNYIRYGFIAAGFTNIAGVLLFSKFFTNPFMNEASPVVMSNFGLLMIIVWGFAYISVSTAYQNVPWLVLLFTVEKLIYTISWILWFKQNDLTFPYTKDLFAGLFYTLYGFNDFLSMLFFGWVFWISRKE